MSEDSKPNSLAARLLRSSAYLFLAVVLLHLTLALIMKIWWVFLILAVIALIIGGLRLWVWWRNPWR